MTKPTTDSKVRCVVAQNVDEARSHLDAWNDLILAAAEVNVFYEPWLLLPAMEHLGEEARGVELVMVYEGQRMIGLFPLQRQGDYRRIPLPSYRLWQHQHCFLCTPLVRAGHEEAAIRALASWVSGRKWPGTRLLVWNWFGDAGPVAQALDAVSRERRWVVRRESFERAVLRKGLPYEQYVRESISGRHRRDFGRLEKRLAELGDLTYFTCSTESEADAWIEDFLKLEASGWKGQEGTAMACREGDRRFFVESVKRSLLDGKAVLFGSRLDGEPVAFKCDFASGSMGFSFKIAFNEKYSKFRPGILLDLQHLKELFAMPFDTMDACASPDSIIGRIWIERRTISNVSIATRRLPEGLAVQALPAAKRVQSWLAGLRKPKATAERPSAPASSRQASEETE